MHELRKLEIQNLLEKNQDSPFVIESLAALRDAAKVGYTSKKAQKSEIIDIYQVRGQLNASRGNPIKGYETLLPRLEEAEHEITISGFGVGQSQVMVFTDPDFIHLYGILYIPKKIC